MQQLRYQAFEILGNLFVCYFLPVLLSSVRIAKSSIKVIVHGCILKRKATDDDYKKHNSYLEDIGRSTIMDFSLDDLRSHVHLGPIECMKFVDVLIRAKSKVC